MTRSTRTTATRRRALAGLLAGLLLAGLLTACGDGALPGEPGRPSVPLRHYSRPADLEKAVTERVRADKTAVTSTSGTAPGRSGEAVDLPAEEGALEMSADGTAAHAYLPLAFEDDEPGFFEAVVRTDDTAWITAPPGLRLIRPPGKPWFGPMQLAETFAGTAEQTLAVLATRAVRTAEPTRAWRSDLYGDGVALDSAVDEELDGVPAVRYRITVDIARAMSGQDDARRKRALQGYLKQGETTNEITLWVDADDRPLRVRQRAGTRDRPTTVDIRYRDWGRPVRIEEPPAAQTAR